VSTKQILLPAKRAGTPTRFADRVRDQKDTPLAHRSHNQPRVSGLCGTHRNSRSSTHPRCGEAEETPTFIASLHCYPGTLIEPRGPAMRSLNGWVRPVVARMVGGSLWNRNCVIPIRDRNRGRSCPAHGLQRPYRRHGEPRQLCHSWHAASLDT
jgi:hypothetical protein